LKYKVTVALDGASEDYEVTADSIGAAVDEATGKRMTEFIQKHGSSTSARIVIEKA
jgi:hypothetical protein